MARPTVSLSATMKAATEPTAARAATIRSTLPVTLNPFVGKTMSYLPFPFVSRGRAHEPARHHGCARKQFPSEPGSVGRISGQSCGTGRLIRCRHHADWRRLDETGDPRTPVVRVIDCEIVCAINH